MRSNLYYILKIAVFFLLIGCGVKFGKYTEADLENQNEDPSTDLVALVKKIKNNGKIEFEAPVIYDNNLSNQWGFEKNTCKDFFETTEIKHSGGSSLALEWNSSNCSSWIGMGIAWNNGNSMDFTPIMSGTAISFYIRSQEATSPFPKWSVTLEDKFQKNKKVDITSRYYERNQLTSSWQNVLIPLDAFGLSSSEVNSTKIYQMLFSFEGKGAIYIDDIELVKFSGTIANPFKKNDDELNPLVIGEKIKLPFSIYENDLNSNWGFETKSNKEVLNQSDVAYNGSQSIYWSWDYSKAPDWVGFGTALKGDYVLLDLTKSDSLALEFYIRTEKKDATELPVMIGLEDDAARSSYVNLDLRYIAGDMFTSKWQKVIIPLTDFGLNGKGLAAGQMKQIILYSEMFSPIKKGELFIDNIKLVSYSGSPGNPFNKERYNLYVSDDKIIKESDPGTNGVFVGGFLTNNPMGTGQTFGRLIGRKPACVMWYSDWFTDLNSSEIQTIIDNGYTPHIVWEAMRATTRDGITLNDIIEGRWDDYIRKTAIQLRQIKGTVQLRLFHEFNGDWYPWCVSVNGRTPENYVKAWRHVVDIFKNENVSNVEWSWCFNKLSGVPNKDAEWNQPAKAYPGDEYVDWVSVDFYNYFPVYDEVWYSFKEHFTPDYIYMARNWPNKPIQIGEFASNKTGGDKAQWFLDMNEDIKKYFPRLKNYNYFEINKEADWRLASSPESQRAFQTIMKDPFNRSSSEGLNNVVKEYPSSIKSDDDVVFLEKIVEERNKQRIASLKKYIDSRKEIRIKKVQSAITIDGNLSEYTKEAFDLSGSKIYMNYDEEFLYLAGDIKDKDPLQNKFDDGMIWNGDAVEIGFGANPKADLYRAKYESTDFHLGIKSSLNGYLFNWNTNAREKVKPAFKETSSGYTFEIKIPLQSIGVNDLQINVSYGFELAIANGKEGARYSQVFWNSNEEGFHQKPYLWGSLIFE